MRRDSNDKMNQKWPAAADTLTVAITWQLESMNWIQETIDIQRKKHAIDIPS